MTDTSGIGLAGQKGLANDTSDFNQINFLVTQMLGLVRTAQLVLVKAVSNSGSVSPSGNVDVQLLVNMIDGLGNSSPHGTIFNLPYARLQGGSNAVIIDPQVGDVGVAVFADRDISAVKNTGKVSNPGSFRRHHLSDGIYLFSVISKTPTQYVQFTADGINITDKNGNTIVMNADGIALNGMLVDQSANVSGIADLTSTGESSLGGGSQPVKLADGSNATKVNAT